MMLPFEPSMLLLLLLLELAVLLSVFIELDVLLFVIQDVKLLAPMRVTLIILYAIK